MAIDNNRYNQINLMDIDQNRINSLIGNIMRRSNVPGISIAIVNGDQTEFLSHGYSCTDHGILVTQHTLFELGSLSKAFTGLAILLLEDEGKISIDDPITNYIPWLTFYYQGLNKQVDLTISNFLFHTSGIPFRSIGNIPQSVLDTAIEETVKTLIGMNLDFFPGTRFQYATINYNVLGYVIEIVSGQSYEEFIQERIIEPLGLHNTYLFHSDAQATGLMSQGYKMTFFRATAFNAPIYRGSTPAGYIISNAIDMARWMQIQLGLIKVSDQFTRIIERSHIRDITVPSLGSYNYASGWYVHIRGYDIQHSGRNPNYSSMLIIQPNNGLGISVLANMNANAAEYLAINILNIIQGRSLTRYETFAYTTLDAMFSVVTIFSILFSISYVVLLIKSLIEIQSKKRVKTEINGAKVAGILLSLPIIAFFGFCIYYLPNILFYRLPWYVIRVWGSPMVQIGGTLGFIAFAVFMLYVLVSFNYQKEKEKGYIALIPLGILNGITSALIIFTINESFNRNMEYSRELLVYFVFALVFFVYTIKLLQGRLIVIANELAYEKRIAMINKIMRSSYQSIENIGRDRIFSGLNNDTVALSEVPGVIVNFISNALTLIFCLSFLLTRSFWAFIASLSIILLNGFISFITGRIASKYWEENRNVQDKYYNQMQDLVNGFKELVLNKLRRFAFWMDMRKYSRMSAELNKSASIKFLNFDLYNTLMYNIVFGVVVFVFPIIFLDLDINQLRENLFIVFYMIGPFSAMAWAIPRITQIKVHVNRINILINDLDGVSTDDELIDTKSPVIYPEEINIQFKDIVYRYEIMDRAEDQEKTEFTLGPITTEFRSGEIVFITGSNGSGKSTFGKLITGLYSPQEGEVLINGITRGTSYQNELFSSVYSDFNLFKKLYGIDYLKKKNVAEMYLELMKIKNKIEINHEGEFDSIDLSTGQKKRLAFVISCLEDKPMVIFDEWAAEQDPEFRAFFYNELLSMLKKQGKGVIVVTHDDRYFDRADKIIKLESGKEIE